MHNSLLPADIDRSGLVPLQYRMHNGRTVYYFPMSDPAGSASGHCIEMVKMDFIFEAGTALQDKMLQSASAIQLLVEGTDRHTAREIAEFLDFRGIIVEKSNDAVSATITFYLMSRYADQLLPLLHEMITSPTYPEREFKLFIDKRRQSFRTSMLKTSYVARCRFYEELYGPRHPLGRFASLDDFDKLTAEDVRDFHRRYYNPSRMTIVLGGDVTPHMLETVDACFGNDVAEASSPIILPPPMGKSHGLVRCEIPNAVQNTLRIGSILPFRWNDVEYCQFMVLSAILGGYFGSRLMSNLREDKGYTYGVNAMTQMYSGSMAFFVTTDVAADKTDAALAEIRKEMDRLCQDPVSDEELELVRTSVLGDFLRTIDGVFERSERFCQQFTCGIDETFADNLMSVLSPDSPDAVTPDILLALANRIFAADRLLIVSAGKQ